MAINRTAMKWILSLVLVAAIAFAAGASFGARTVFATAKVQMNGLQAMLAFNRIMDERRWHDLLSKGCVPQAAKGIDIALDQDTKLLAEFFNGKLDAGTVKYVTDRDPILVSQLKTFKSKYGNSWWEEECKTSAPPAS